MVPDTIVVDPIGRSIVSNDEQITTQGSFQATDNVGRVTASSLNVRVWAGTGNPVVSFSTLKKGTGIGICDEMTDLENEKW